MPDVADTGRSGRPSPSRETETKAPPKANGSAKPTVAAAAATPVRPKPNVTFLNLDAEPRLQIPPVELSGHHDVVREDQVPSAEDDWIPLAQADAHFPLKAWWTVMLDLVRHPERNSTYILRADILSERTFSSSGLRRGSKGDEAEEPGDAFGEREAECSYKLEKVTERRLLPRNPNIDKSLDQACSFYRRKRRRRQQHSARALHSPDGTGDGGASAMLAEDGLVVYTPRVSPGSTDPESEIPWYHPKVKALAFRYLADVGEDPSPLGAAHGAPDFPKRGTLRIDVQLFPSSLASMPPLESSSGSTALPVDHRLMRTAKSLLETQHKHAFGVYTSYAKRVRHDVVVPRDIFQDKYIELKMRYASELMSSWQEKTDPQKHVFEDLGIAAFLIILWQITYADVGGRPPGGFVDLGCGNGLLVHILRREGFEGFGFDLRMRKSWANYETVKEGHGDAKDLRVVSLDAPASITAVGEEHPVKGALRLPKNSFLIGNHADELTPWVPLLAAATSGERVGFINIPCCPWQLDGDRFGRVKFKFDESNVADLLGHPDDEVVAQTMKNLELGPAEPHKTLRNLAAQSSSRNVAYLSYVGMLQLEAGWHIEKEVLRIPSTKNWCLVGRRRVWQPPPPTFDTEANGRSEAPSERAHSTHEEVMERIKQMAADAAPGWKARTPEGNAGLASTTHA